MKLNNEILLECINYIHDYKFNEVESYMFFGEKSILVTVNNFKSDINYYARKTVEIYFNDYEIFERKFKLKKIIN